MTSPGQDRRDVRRRFAVGGIDHVLEGFNKQIVINVKIEPGGEFTPAWRSAGGDEGIVAKENADLVDDRIDGIDLNVLAHKNNIAGPHYIELGVMGVQQGVESSAGNSDMMGLAIVLSQPGKMKADGKTSATRMADPLRMIEDGTFR